MYHTPYTYSYPYGYFPVYQYGAYPTYWRLPNQWTQPYPINDPITMNEESPIRNNDHGGQPYVINIEEATKGNSTFRTAIWTGQHLQVTLMSINVGEDIGLEVHPHVDQFLRIEAGEGIVQMGDTRENVTFRHRVSDNDAVMVPAGKWHNITNTGNTPLRLYSIYAPPEHPFGTIHHTKADVDH